MSDRRPAPEQPVHDGPVTVPRKAATVIVLRGDDGLEVLLVRRTPRARFMGGAWVFPGGALDPADGEGASGLRAAGVREVAEEAGIALGSPDGLVTFSRWITPARVKIRYDTWFFLAMLPGDQEARVDGGEIVDARWLSPAAALRAFDRDELTLVFPTLRHLQMLTEWDSASELFAYARGRTVEPVEPRVVGSGEQARILLPGEAGYEA